MKMVLFAVLALLGSKVCAQSHLIGVRGELNVAKVSSKYINNYPVFLVNSGITYECVLPSGFFIGAGVNYDRRGYYDLTKMTDENARSLQDLKNDYRFDYLSLPIKAGYYFGNTLVGFGSIGVSPGILLKARVNSSGDPTREFENRDLGDEVSSFNIEGFAEVGGGYKINSRCMVSASISYQHSFRGIYRDYPFFARHTSKIFSLGFKYSIAGPIF